MAQSGKLKLSLVDVYGKRLQERVDISLRNLSLTHAPTLRNLDASKTISISGLFTAPHGVYQMIIDPPSYHPTNRFVTIKASGATEVTIPFAIDQAKVLSVNFPAFTTLVKDLRDLLDRSTIAVNDVNLSGAALAAALGDIPKAGLLNIARKTQATLLPGGKTVLALVKELKELRGDRFFAYVERELREETLHGLNTGLFNAVPEILHKLPPPFLDFTHAGSFKTDDHFGNLQLTFFRKGEELVADIDIDDAGGLGHIFQVLKNHFTGNPTHPYNIHEILVQHQHLDPKYTFNLQTG